MTVFEATGSKAPSGVTPSGRLLLLISRMGVRSVELIPVIAVKVLAASVFARLPGFSARMHWFLKRRPGAIVLTELVPAK